MTTQTTPTSHPSHFNKFRTRKILLLALLPFLSTQLFAMEPKAAFHLNAEFEKQYSFSIAVKAGDFLRIGGVTSVDKDGKEVYAGDATKQMQLIYERMAAILKAHGADFSNVVSETIYYKTDNDIYFKALETRAAVYKGLVAPSASGVRVVDFASDSALIEITAVAYLGK